MSSRNDILRSVLGSKGVDDLESKEFYEWAGMIDPIGGSQDYIGNLMYWAQERVTLFTPDTAQREIFAAKMALRHLLSIWNKIRPAKDRTPVSQYRDPITPDHKELEGWLVGVDTHPLTYRRLRPLTASIPKCTVIVHQNGIIIYLNEEGSDESQEYVFELKIPNPLTASLIIGGILENPQKHINNNHYECKGIV